MLVCDDLLSRRNRPPSKLSKLRVSQQRYAKAPKYVGQQSFDLENGLVERPIQTRKRKATDDTVQRHKRPKLWLMDCPEGIAVELDKMGGDVDTEELRGYVWCNTCYASSRTPAESGSTIEPNDTPSKRVLRSIQSVQDETKQLLNAIGTTEADFNAELEILKAQLTPGQPCIMKQTRLVLALCKSLLNLKFDFLVLARPQVAQQDSEDLAQRYEMASALWQQNIKPTLDVLQYHLHEENREVLGEFLSMCDLWLRSSGRHVPDLRSEWDMIEDNMRKYLSALKADGICVPDRCTKPKVSPEALDHDLSWNTIWNSRSGLPDCLCTHSHDATNGWESSTIYKAFTNGRCNNQAGIEDCINRSDEDWLQQIQIDHDRQSGPHQNKQYQLPIQTPDVVRIQKPCNTSSYNDVVLAFMSGWLHYGSRIAQTLHTYSKVFTFFAWAGGPRFLSSVS